MPLVHQHEVVVAEVANGNPLHPLFLGELVHIDNLDRRQQAGASLSGENARWQVAGQQFAFVLFGQLLVRRHQNDIAGRPVRRGGEAPVLQDMGVHDEGLARAGGGLHGNGAQPDTRDRRPAMLPGWAAQARKSTAATASNAGTNNITTRTDGPSRPKKHHSENFSP